MDQDNFSLDQLIKIVNVKCSETKQYATEPNPQAKQKLPPILSNKRITSEDIISPPTIKLTNTLTFKPWSGIVNYNHGLQNFEGEENRVQTIKQEIQNEEQELSPQKQDYVSEHNITNKVSQNEIGYFYKFQSGKVRLIKYLLDQNGFKDACSNKNWTLYWSSSAIKMEVYHNLLPYQKVNHFPNSFHITRKDLMNKNISKMQVKYGITNYNFLPKTYILPQQIDLFMSQANKYANTYIVKPHNRSQGKGITVTNSIQTIISKLQKYSSVIVSHYIENPLLINRLKFDLRIYVAVTGVNPLRIYVYEQGLARFATEEYDMNAFNLQSKRFQHLTNYSVNKKNTDFVPSNNEEYFGSKWSLTSLKDFLAFNIGKNQTTQVFQRINDLIVKTILSVQNTLFTSFSNNVHYINGCFQVFGFDVLIDSNLKPWLVQVNLSPSMNTDSKMDLKIKGNMISDLFTMIGISPLSQRYLDGGHSRYETRHYLKSQELKRQDSAIDKFIIKEVESENERRGGWNRVFPTKNNTKYKNFFQVDRYFNRVIRQHLTQPSKYFIQSSYNKTTNERKQQLKKNISTANKTPNTKVSIRINRSKRLKKNVLDNSLY